MSRRILTLTTDFGADGPYVAAIKGVVLGLVDDCTIVDVSHRIAPQNILEGAFVLASVFESFPAGTVHLAVVDPGVGMDRPLVAMRVGGQWVVAPDNGLLCGVSRLRVPESVWEISNPALKRTVVSHTFHGRDILAPAAAHLLRGLPERELGPAREKIVDLANFEPREVDHGLLGEIIFRDAFGNLVTNVRAEHLRKRAGARWRVELGGVSIEGLVRTYGERPAGEVVALVGSSGWVEIAVVNGDAARQLGAGAGSTVWFHARQEEASA